MGDHRSSHLQRSRVGEDLSRWLQQRRVGHRQVHQAWWLHHGSAPHWYLFPSLPSLCFLLIYLSSGLQSGNYLMRFELLALHQGYNLGQGQFYVGCLELSVTGGSTPLPGSPYAVAFPGTSPPPSSPLPRHSFVVFLALFISQVPTTTRMPASTTTSTTATTT